MIITGRHERDANSRARCLAVSFMRLGLPLFMVILVLGFYTGLRLVPHVPTAAL